jgi:tRNA 2-thiouridine synthesizing protein A
VDQTWDAGDIGCARFVMELRRRVDALPPGGRLRLVATDPGVGTDLPAWCRMTGHRLVAARPPVFLIERRQRGGPRAP